MDEDQQQQWIVVKSRKRKHIEKDIKPQKIFVKGGNKGFSKQVNINLEEQFLSCIGTEQNIKIINKVCKGLLFNKVQVNCLGIGNFTSFLKPQIQMLFLKHCIIKQLQQSYQSFEINIYDPVFTSAQKEQIKKLKSSCEQFEKIDKQSLYIMYMPHCDRFLYEKLCHLKLQQSQTEIIVIGNSINQYKQRCLLTKEKIPTVFLPFSPCQIKIKDFKQALNDTFIYRL